ncbi:hypothetical protein J3R83DRAFT_4794 [Lanmaoa asiatica]|nr:hypothetical protein J3R83DRAFT_4794 [Lanmaoa asiatica]
MSIQEPAWLKRTRPCLFFSQGRCLFADSCNFLHDVKVRNAVNEPLLSVKQPSLPPKLVFHPPSVVVDSASPRSVNQASPESPAGSIQDSSRYSGLLSVLSDVIGPSSNPPTTQPDPEATLVDPFGHQMEAFFPEMDGDLVAEFPLVPDNEDSADGDATSYFVEATETYVIGSEVEEGDDDQDVDDYGEEDPTVVVSNRQSTLSSFTGASLLASPRNSVFGESSVASIVDDAVDLLSPVELSAKLQPFPIPSLGSEVKRGDSIDSGYADGTGWVDPFPFPCSPPRSFRSPVTFLSHSWRTSHSSPVLQDRRVSYDVGALRTFPRNIKKVGAGESDNEDTAYANLGTYDASPSEEHGESDACDALQVNVTVVTEEKAEEDDELSELPAVLRSSPEYLYPTREYDPDSCNQPSFVSDDNLSFKTALSTQPSYEDLSDISKISSVKQDSLLSSFSGRTSTPNTSVLSHYGDANEPLEQPIVDSQVCESSYHLAATGVAGRIGSPGISEARVLAEECSFSEEVTIDPNVIFASASANDLQGLSPEKAVASRGPLSNVFHFDKRSSISSPSVDTSHSLSSAKDILGYVPLGTGGLWEFAPEEVVTPRERLSGALHFVKHLPKSNLSSKISYSPPPLRDAFSSSSPCGDDFRELAPEIVVAPRECLPGILHYDRRSPKSSPSTESSHGPSSCKDALDYVPAVAGDVQECTPENVVTPQKRSSGVLHCDKPSPNLSSSAESFRSPSSVKDVLGYATADTGGNGSGSSESSPTLLHGCLAECAAAGADQSLGSVEVIEAFDSECDNFTQRLSFPLPPPFLPFEVVGHSDLSGEEGTSVLSEAPAANPEKDVLNACTGSQDGEVQPIRSGSDLTERARLSQAPFSRVSRSRHSFYLAKESSRIRSHCERKVISCDYSRGHFLYIEVAITATGAAGSTRFPSPAHQDTEPPDASGLVGEPSQGVRIQSLDLTSYAFQRVSAPCSDGKPNNSGTDSPRSEHVLRPLLTGQRSFLHSSLSELVSKANLATVKAPSPTHPYTRLQPAATQSLQNASQPLHTVPSASELQEVLRIRTDIVEEDSPPGCYSASHVSFTTRSPLPVKSMSAPPTGRLKQLRLSSVMNKSSSILSIQSSSIASSTLSLDHIFNSSAIAISQCIVYYFVNWRQLSSSCERIPKQTHHTLEHTSSNSPILQTADDACFASQSSSTRRDSRSVSAPTQQPKSWRLSHYRAGSRNYLPVDRLSRRTSTLSLSCVVDEEETNEHDSTISRPIQSKHADDWTRPTSVLAAPIHAIATPKPTLLFAIASDDVDQVRQVLESGEAGPNDSVGPQSALAFTLTNDKLAHKQEIVKALLAYGANPSALRNPTLNPASRRERGDEPSTPPAETTLEGMDPATRYFVARADAVHSRQTSQLIYRSFFRPLTRVRYDVIGQDWALEQLFRMLSMHSQKLALAPIVVLLCGPSGHGKSLLARKFGSLLDSYSMSPYEEPSSCTLAEFLIENEGKRCVVVLDEIEKVEDQKALWSLLMPWELGRCSLEAGKRHVDACNVIWLGTSNVGHELVFEHHENRAEPDKRMSREEYLELTGMLRPRVSHCLGASLVSRVTTVLPFVPFTLDEKKAIAAEAVYGLATDASKILSAQDVESLVMKALPSYHPSEGARSLHRAISNILVDTL